MFVDELNFKVNRNHFVVVVLPLFLAILLVSLGSWSGALRASEVSAGLFFFYVISFLYLCKKLKMTKNDSFILSAISHAVLLVAVVIMLIGSFGFNLVGILMSLSFILAFLIGAAISLVTYGFLLYLVISTINERTKNWGRPKKRKVRKAKPRKKKK